MRYLGLLIVLLTGWALLPLACASKPTVDTKEEVTEIPVSPEVEAKYQKAEKLYQEKKYKKAYKLSKKTLRKTKNPGQHEKIMFLMAESLFQRKKYESAYKAYEKFIAEHPQTGRLNDVINRQYEIAFAFVRGKNRTLFGLPILPASEYGMDIVRKTMGKYPYTAASEKNHITLADYLFKRGRHEDAQSEYEAFSGIYTQSVFLPKAHLMIGRCFLMEYQGAEYDIAPLLAAKKEFQGLIEQYPDDPARTEAQKHLTIIISREAERDYSVGRFYYKTGKTEAARKYLQSVLNNYPETQWAKKAEVMLKENKIADQPERKDDNPIK